MDLLTRTDMTSLRQHATEKSECVSILMPTHRTGREIRDDSIRGKNLLNEAEELLISHGMRSSTARDMLKPARDLMGDEEFWKHQSDGLALFIAPEIFRTFRLPVELQELCVVGQRFEVTPLVPVLQGDGEFYILAVSSNRVRLLRGSRFHVDELHPHSLPTDLRSALNIDEYVESLQQHGHTSVGVSASDARATPMAGQGLFHGHGGGEADDKKQHELRGFFQRIDNALQAFFGEERAPLVFAGVDYLFPIFQKHCHYQRLVDQPVTGNPDELREDELHAQAWPLVSDLFERDQETALQRLQEAHQSNLASSELADILAAARDGRVDTLFVARNQHVWGRVDNDHIVPGEPQDPETCDLLNDAALTTLNTRGRVFCLDSAEMPDKKPIAALFRYAP